MMPPVRHGRCAMAQRVVGGCTLPMLTHLPTLTHQHEGRIGTGSYCHSPMGVQLPLTVPQPAELQVADGDPLNPVLQVAVQVEPNALLAPHEKVPLETTGLPLHTGRAKASTWQH